MRQTDRDKRAVLSVKSVGEKRKKVLQHSTPVRTSVLPFEPFVDAPLTSLFDVKSASVCDVLSSCKNIASAGPEKCRISSFCFLSKMTLGIMTLDIMTLGITTFIMPRNSVIMLSAIIVNVAMLCHVAIFAMK